jgi:hypothetical protein
MSAEATTTLLGPSALISGNNSFDGPKVSQVCASTPMVMVTTSSVSAMSPMFCTSGWRA